MTKELLQSAESFRPSLEAKDRQRQTMAKPLSFSPFDLSARPVQARPRTQTKVAQGWSPEVWRPEPGKLGARRWGSRGILVVFAKAGTMKCARPGKGGPGEGVWGSRPNPVPRQGWIERQRPVQAKPL